MATGTYSYGIMNFSYPVLILLKFVIWCPPLSNTTQLADPEGCGMVAGVKWVGGGGGMKWVGGVSYYFILGTFPARGKLITFYQGHHPPHPLLPLCPPPLLHPRCIVNRKFSRFILLTFSSWKRGGGHEGFWTNVWQQLVAVYTELKLMGPYCYLFVPISQFWLRSRRPSPILKEFNCCDSVGCEVKFIKGLLSHNFEKALSRAVDPVPQGSAFIFSPGSGSRRTKNSRKKQKKCQESSN